MVVESADAEMYLATPLEGYRIARFGTDVRMFRPDGTICQEHNCLTINMASLAMWEVRENAYAVANAGGHL